MSNHEQWARTVHTVLTTPFPYAAQHVSLGPRDVEVSPKRLHPSFHGSFDWHSSVHMHWSAVVLLCGGVDDPELTSLLDERLSGEHVATEAAYLSERRSFERPYGWAWLARLAATCATERRWHVATEPLLGLTADLFGDWLPTLATPNRTGEHSNMAFALTVLRDAMRDVGRDDVVTLVDETARRLYLDDRDAPVAYEPGPSDFLSPSLTEAALMRRVLAEHELTTWLEAFLPELGHADDPLLDVPEVRDPTDGKGAHLVGLALSRAWQLRELAPAVPHVRRLRMHRAASAQVDSAERYISDGDFMATHWLVSFALLAHRAAEGADTLSE